MNEMLLPILVAVTVILLIWGIYQVVGGMSDERKKIQERLSNEGKATEGFDPTTLTVIRRVRKIGGFSGTLAHLPFLGGIAAKISQVWPRFSLAKFVFLTLGLSLMGFTVLFVVTGATLLGSAAAVVFAFIPNIVLN